MIRVRSVGQPIPQAITGSANQQYKTIKGLFKAISVDLQGGSAFRYARNISGGLQEFIEAIVFQHYLEHQKLLSYNEAVVRVKRLCADGTTYQLGVEDYVLGILDTSGELMRFAITTMALSGQDIGHTAGAHKEQPTASRTVLDDLRKLHLFLTNMDCESDFHFKKDFQGKLAVMDASVDKVEKALYGLIVRGSEKPKGWMPDLQDDGQPSRLDSGSR